MKTSRKGDFASFQTSFSRLSQVVLLLKIREFRLELKREDGARVQKEMAELIALPFPFSRKLNIWSFHVVVVQGQQSSLQKGVMHVQRCFLFCSLELLLFFFYVPVAVAVVVSYGP